MASFKNGTGNWTQYRSLGSHFEIDFHHREKRPNHIPYGQAMGEIYSAAIQSLKDAYEQGVEYIIFTHGYSTSRLGQTTARSMVRSLMRSKEATPYIIRSQCIQHYSVFVAAIRPKPV